MRTGIDHLPSHKQRELERVVQIIFEQFGDAIALGCHDWKKQGRIPKVILYGSYAGGTFVDEPHTAKGYRSDVDLLIIVSDKRLTDRVKFWASAEDRLLRELVITKTLNTPVNFIVHTLQEVNDGLAHGRYFFMDVAKEGIALYDSDGSELHTPSPRPPTGACDGEGVFRGVDVGRDEPVQARQRRDQGRPLKGRGVRPASDDRTALPLRAARLHLLHAPQPQHRVPAHPCRAA